MAPEAAGNLVVLECKRLTAECQVHRFDPMDWKEPSILHASFAATNPPPGFDSVAGGAVYVDRGGYQAKSYSAKLARQGSWFAWRHPVHRNGLMAVVVLPANQTLPSVDDARPVFIESKVLESGQLVLHWEVSDNQRHEAEFAWRIQPTKLTLEEMSQHSALLNEESAKRRQTATYTENTASPAFPSWAAKAGAIFGGLTLVFFMAVVFATMTGHVIPPSGRFPIIAVLALGLAMATAFLAGDAVAKGRLPVPFLKDNPIQFSVAGGVAVFVIVLLIGNSVFGSSPSPDGPSPAMNPQPNTERVVPPAAPPVKQCTGEKTLVFTPKDPGVMQTTPDGRRVALGDGGGGTTLEQWKYSWRAPATVTSVHCTVQRNEHVLAENKDGSNAECVGSINGGADAMTMRVSWDGPCDQQ